jgi:hypothetical protein
MALSPLFFPFFAVSPPSSLPPGYWGGKVSTQSGNTNAILAQANHKDLSKQIFTHGTLFYLSSVCPDAFHDPAISKGLGECFAL